jgi:hypothetical protein
MSIFRVFTIAAVSFCLTGLQFVAVATNLARAAAALPFCPAYCEANQVVSA